MRSIIGGWRDEGTSRETVTIDMKTELLKCNIPLRTHKKCQKSMAQLPQLTCSFQ